MLFSKKPWILFFLSVSAISLLTSCGQDFFQNPNTRSESGNCGSEVVSDYNDVVRACRWSLDRNDCGRIKNLFLDKYPKVNCRAQKGHGLGAEEFTLKREMVVNM